MALWEKVIDIIYERAKGKPRRELVSAVVSLRDHMVGCQGWYGRLNEARLAGRETDTGYPNPRVEWIRALTMLGDDMLNLDRVLGVFSPEAHERISRYVYEESLEVGATETLGAAASDLGESPGFDLPTARLDGEFAAALERLDTFIRSYFTPEEIASAEPRW